mmetsp:Transcript_63017/g.136838  ORF Transcript_63017/g.136838 Transcript_63017/m.136838 type:complete len:420 (-) Transcript_63017:163-1422(-)
MGALISAPLSAMGTCLGGCAGTFLASGCFHLAATGKVGSARAAKCVLVWLQVFTVLLAFLIGSTAKNWLPGLCDGLGNLHLGEVGICECRGRSDESRCWFPQVVYRMEASACMVLLGLLIMTVSGCAEGASRSRTVAKFMAVFIFGFVLLFIPNSPLDVFGTAATSASALFLIAQAVFLIDFGYSWNELWYSNALAAHRREIGVRGYWMWVAAVLVAAAVLIAGSLAFSVYFFVSFKSTPERCLTAIAVLAALMLLAFSITNWCAHGALLTSAVVTAYTVWLVCEALAAAPHDPRPTLPAWLALAMSGVSLTFFAHSTGLASKSSAQSQALVDAGGESGLAEGAADGEAAAGVSAGEVKDFALQCVVHLAAALYVAASLAPVTGKAPFAFRSVAVFTSLALYGWSLVAPHILTNRSFEV